jgi:CPA1 family monovalent cation:H+ antiporter
MERDYQQKAQAVEQEITTLKQQSNRFHEEEQQEAIRRVLIVEKEAVFNAYQQGTLNKEVYEHLTAELDERIAKAKDAEAHGAPEDAHTPPPQALAS